MCQCVHWKESDTGHMRPEWQMMKYMQKKLDSMFEHRATKEKKKQEYKKCYSEAFCFATQTQ